MAKQSYLVDPSHLKPFDRSDKTLLRVVIETPKGSLRWNHKFHTGTRSASP